MENNRVGLRFELEGVNKLRRSELNPEKNKSREGGVPKYPGGKEEGKRSGESESFAGKNFKFDISHQEEVRDRSHLKGRGRKDFQRSTKATKTKARGSSFKFCVGGRKKLKNYPLWNGMTKNSKHNR